MTPETRLGKIAWLNTSDSFGMISRLLHWATAILIAINIPLGFYVAYLPRGDLFREELLSLVHKPLGVLLLFLVVARLVWKIISLRPGHAAGLKRWENRLARAVHVSLYVLLVAVPLSGILLSQNAGHSVSFFGLFDLPVLLPIDLEVPVPQRPLVKVGAIFHTAILDIALIAALFLHLAGVIKHHLIDGRRLEVRRMWGIPTD
jgi:cytochrome b561